MRLILDWGEVNSMETQCAQSAVSTNPGICAAMDLEQPQMESQKGFVWAELDLWHHNFQAVLHVSSHQPDAKDSSQSLGMLRWHVVSCTPRTLLSDSYWIFHCLTRTWLIQAVHLLLANWGGVKSCCIHQHVLLEFWRWLHVTYGGERQWWFVCAAQSQKSLLRNSKFSFKIWDMRLWGKISATQQPLQLLSSAGHFLLIDLSTASIIANDKGLISGVCWDLSVLLIFHLKMFVSLVLIIHIRDSVPIGDQGRGCSWSNLLAMMYLHLLILQGMRKKSAKNLTGECLLVFSAIVDTFWQTWL